MPVPKYHRDDNVYPISGVMNTVVEFSFPLCQALNCPPTAAFLWAKAFSDPHVKKNSKTTSILFLMSNFILSFIYDDCFQKNNTSLSAAGTVVPILAFVLTLVLGRLFW